MTSFSAFEIIYTFVLFTLRFVYCLIVIVIYLRLCLCFFNYLSSSFFGGGVWFIGCS